MNGHARRRWPQLAVGVAGCVGLVASGVLAWPRLRVGDVDPASLVVGLASLAAAVWPIWQARRQEQDVGSAADRLARTVAVLAGHLARDAGTNIVLHELWPLAGRGGPRAIAFGLSWIWPVAAFVLAMVLPRHLVGPLATSVTVPLVCLECYLIRQKLDRDRPSRRHIDLRRLGTARGRLLFGWRFCAGMVVGFLFMLAVEAVTAAVTGRWPSLQLPIGTGLVLGLAIATVVGLGVDSDSLAVRPRDLLRNDVLSAVVGLLPATVACAVIVGTQGSTLFSYDLHRGALLGTLLLAVPAGVGFVFALGLGVQALRYLSFLLCCRRWNRVHLPFRLGHFLGWCHHVGLLRVSGVAYQFRHRELQDHLARSTA